MAEVLTGPLAIAALVVGIAGAAKLRAPATAAGALQTLGVPGGRRVVRALAVLELLAAGWSLAAPGRASSVCLGCAYAGFAVTALLLAHRQAACGCFGGGQARVSAVHWILSGGLGVACGLAATWPPARVTSTALAIGVAGAAYAVVLVYTELPTAWSAWSGR